MKKLLLLFLITGFAFGFDYFSIKSDFTQTITSPEGQVLHYSGKFYAKKPYSALWEYEKPVKKFVYFENKTIKIVEPELEQVIISNLSKSPNISELLKKAKKIKNDLYEAKYEDTIYHIFTKNDIPKKINYKDKLDNQTNIIFSNTKIDINLDNKIFNFKIPADYDILRQ